ncbi:MAG: bifunctional demethylmenaquinone methyltransferase/2-methoxy-6-polyprenyl-1,4-benzoquinol methylase UbiE [Proteobacteria bacterium]|nr:bifunctional demethylmenaquinone methyltransferase/2-methoxy-6-polyprenyl-1,4-benzoquinol methylase UbiE [Pseudomonadota bacterium]
MTSSTTIDTKIEQETHFGYKTVASKDKEKMVGAVFTSVAAKYDIMNDFMSMGVHRLWKRHFVLTCGIEKGAQVLDLAGGTGDIAKLLAPKVTKSGHIIVGDINQEMLDVGKARMLDAGLFGLVTTQQMNAEQLPFADDKFDLITMAFGLRNVTNQQKALNDMYRVLKPGGKLMVLEFTTVNLKFLAKIYDFYSFKILPEIGEIIAKDRDSYQYLAESIRKHPNQRKLKSMFETAGFELCKVENMSGGIVAIHTGYKT